MKNERQLHWEFNCKYERGRILRGPDCHYCYDWDGLPISACTPEYDCCVCYKKTRLGRLVNWLYMWHFNRRMRKVCGQ